MGKTALCIQMLQILNTGRRYKISELANLLDTNPRNILEYRNELQECGYLIDGSYGKYGGYKLDKSNLIPSIQLTDNDRNIISDGINYINNRNDYPNKDAFTKCMSRVMSSFEHEFINEQKIINHYPLVISEEELRNIYNKLHNAIKDNIEIKIKYNSQRKNDSLYTFDPYQLFMYNNSWFVIGWNKTIGNISYFRINRIISIEFLDNKFKVWKNYNINDYIDEYGFKSNGDWYHVEFIAKSVYARLCKERIYGKNQSIKELDDDNTFVSVDMQNKESIKQFILGFGQYVEVLEPEWLKADLKSYAKFILKKYK